MKIKLLTICLLLVTSQVFADPISYADDWHVLDENLVNSIYSSQQDVEIFLSERFGRPYLNLRKNKKERSVPFRFTDKNYDIYLVKNKNNKEIIYIFNHNKEKIYQAELFFGNMIFKQILWDFGSLKGIYKNCNVDEDSVFFKLKNSHFLTKYAQYDRAKKLQCYLLIGGGRCESLISDKSGKHLASEMMVLYDTYEYIGDIRGIAETIDKAGCEFYKKMNTVMSKKTIAED